MPAPQITQTLVAPVRGSGGAAYTSTADAFAAALPAWAAQANAQADYLDALALSVTGSGAFTNVTATGTVSAGGKVILPITPATALAATSGTSLDFTGIPTTARRVTVLFNAVSTSGTSPLVVRGGAGAFEATGYLSRAQRFDSGSSAVPAQEGSTVGFNLSAMTAAHGFTGSLTLTRFDAASQLWIAALNGFATDGSTVYPMFGSGSKTFSGALDRIRLTTAGGTDTFDAGSVNIAWE